MTKKYIEENAQTEDSDINLWIDIEQALFNLVNNLLLKHPINLNIFYYSSQLLYYLTSNTKDLDNYINTDKYISKIKSNLDLITDNNIKLIYKGNMVKLLGLLFKKSEQNILNLTYKSFIIEIIFSNFIDSSGYIVENKDNIKQYFNYKNGLHNLSLSFKSPQSDQKDENIINLITDIRFILILDSCETYYKYLFKYVTDVTTGKKIWKEVERFLKNNLHDKVLNYLILELVILYIFNKSKNYISDSNRKIMSSILEFICDDFVLNKTDYNFEFESIPGQVNNYSNNNINLFYEIISTTNETILAELIINERYMHYFARIFIEEIYYNIFSIGNYDDSNVEKLLLRLIEVIKQNPDQTKLLISLLSHISKYFQIQSNFEYPDNFQKSTNLQFMEKIYLRVIDLINKFPNLKEKQILDKDEVFNIINNFSIDDKLYRNSYVTFFTKFVLFIEFNFKLELEFNHRKNCIYTYLKCYMD